MPLLSYSRTSVSTHLPNFCSPGDGLPPTVLAAMGQRPPTRGSPPAALLGDPPHPRSVLSTGSAWLQAAWPAQPWGRRDKGPGRVELCLFAHVPDAWVS